MSFISVLFALLLEQVRPMHRGGPVQTGMRGWVGWCARNFDVGRLSHGWITWCLAVALPAVLAWVIYLLLDSFTFWPLALVWNVAVLYMTLGFRQFSSHFTRIRDALAAGDEEQARQLLTDWSQLEVGASTRSEIVRRVIEHSVLAAHHHVFGVLLCFSLLAAIGLGPAGAVLYRLSEFVARYWRHKAQTQQLFLSDALQQTALDAWTMIDWLPARVTATGFGVVGSFEDAIESWRNYAASPTANNDGIVLAAAAGAVNIRLGGGAQSLDDAPELDVAHLAVVVGLVWRSVVMWMLLLALLTLARLLG